MNRVTKTDPARLNRLVVEYADEALALRPMTPKALAAMLRRHGEEATPRIVGDLRVALIGERMRRIAAETFDRR